MPTRRRLLLGGAAALASALGGCNSPLPAASGGGRQRLHLLGEARLPHRLAFRGTQVGGLSGIDYDNDKGEYLLLSDDRSDMAPARFYTARWAFGAIPELSEVTSLRQADGTTWAPRRQAREGVPVPDPEALRLRPDTGSILWTSEGDEARGFGPALYESRRDGSLLRQFELPAMFEPSRERRRGARDNLGFEGLALTPDNRHCWLAMENALAQDGAVPSVDSAGGPCRFTRVELSSGRAVGQIAYQPDRIPMRPLLTGTYADNGVSEILMLDAHRMLVLERAYATGVGNSLRLYEIDTRDATDTLALDALTPGNHRAATRTLVADFATLGLSRLDNTEGMCWGPPLPDGQRVLVVVSDDNFNPLQVTQFAAFAFTDRP
ncbi:esterase-like activity of phytase family protein [Variovorax fucosicus]|uniref:esterase-like activity of phytase family protein n=1 Tax=Variovorax fucosicus TaxID=3053517 RepID=UPI00257713CF|nr:esterase-like activity of phytase family protein [Variovorax sp. J22G47]MDM0055688.1 esterase-like activity of phytase family protein [Variovorax sp. J22G47]